MAEQNAFDPARRSRQERYAILCEGRDSVTIDYLATALGVSYDTAMDDIRQMVAAGRFGMHAYIDYYTKRLILRSKRNSDWGAWANFAGQTAETVRTAVNDSLNRAASSMASNRQPSKSGATTYRTQQSSPQEKKRRRQFYTKSRGWMLALAIVFFYAGIAMASNALKNLTLLTPELQVNLISNLTGCAVYLGTGILLLVQRARLGRRAVRFDTYQAMSEGRAYVTLSSLASATGVTQQVVQRDVENMLSKNLFKQTAFIDAGARCLVLDRDAYSMEKQRQEPEPESKKEPPAQSEESEYYVIIREIRKLNDAIADEQVSARIFRIEELTAKIFRVVEEKPEKQPQIRSFMSYYLPTTLKLLRNYSFLERQGVDGENIAAAKKNISEMLDKLETGFVRQLDQLFKAEAMDISSDVDVLESMMKRDGFTDGGMKRTTS